MSLLQLSGPLNKDHLPKGEPNLAAASFGLDANAARVGLAKRLCLRQLCRPPSPFHKAANFFQDPLQKCFFRSFRARSRERLPAWELRYYDPNGKGGYIREYSTLLYKVSVRSPQ